MLEITIAILVALHPKKDIETWFEDEARLGLKPTIRRRWALKGQRPMAPSDTRYKWLYAYAFVHPTDGRSSWFLFPTVNGTLMSIALREFINDVDPAHKRIIVLIVDQAGFHTTPNIVVPENVVIRFLPSHTPELQPVESVWPLLREAMHNRSFVELDDLQEVLVQRCNYLLEHPEVVHAHTGFSWACCTVKR